MLFLPKQFRGGGVGADLEGADGGRSAGDSFQKIATAYEVIF